MSENNPYATPEARVEDRFDAESYELAARGTRLGAAIIDGLLGMAVAYPVFTILGTWSQVRSDGSLPFSSVVLVFVVGLLLFVPLHGYLLKKNGQTIGKKLLGIRIVDMTGQVPDFWRLIGLRYVPIMILSVMTPLVRLLGIVDVLFIFRSDRRCIHDMIAGTRVIVAR